MTDTDIECRSGETVWLAHSQIVCLEVGILDHLGVSGVVIADQVKSLDWRVRRASICKLPSQTINEVIQKLATIIVQSIAH